MIDRRQFFQGISAGAVLPAPRIQPTPVGVEMGDYHQILERTQDMDILGRPRSWSVVTQGFHPFSPERTVVCNKFSGHTILLDIRSKIEAEVQKEIAESKARHPDYQPEGEWFPMSKRHSILFIMEAITEHYRVPALFEPWVMGLLRRELLGTSSMGPLALAHQFQMSALANHSTVVIPVASPPVDWWLFLYPEGVNWGNLDDGLTYAVISHVTRNHFYAAGLMLRVYCLTSSLRPSDWRQVATMGRVEASRHLNRLIADELKDQERYK